MLNFVKCGNMLMITFKTIDKENQSWKRDSRSVSSTSSTTEEEMMVHGGKMTCSESQVVTRQMIY